MRNFAHMQLDMAREQVKAWETAVAELDPVVDHYHAELKAEGGGEERWQGGRVLRGCR